MHGKAISSSQSRVGTSELRQSIRQESFKLISPNYCRLRASGLCRTHLERCAKILTRRSPKGVNAIIPLFTTGLSAFHGSRVLPIIDAILDLARRDIDDQLSELGGVARTRETLGCHARSMASLTAIENPVSRAADFRLTHYLLLLIFGGFSGGLYYGGPHLYAGGGLGLVLLIVLIVLLVR